MTHTTYPEHLDCARGNILEHIVDVGWLAPMWDLLILDDPYISHFLHVLWIVVISESRKLSVASTLSIVLRSRLPAPLVNTTFWLANQTSEEVDIVNLTRAGGGLVCLIYSLERVRQKTFRGANDVCSPL